MRFPTGKLGVCILFLSLVFSDSIFAQAVNQTDMSSSEPLTSVLASDLLSTAEDLVGFATSPASFTVEDWMLLGVAGVGVGFAWQYDERLDAHVPSTSSGLFRVSDYYGDLRLGQGLTAVFYVTGLVTQDEKLRRTGRRLFKTILYSGMITSVLKYSVGRARPYTNRGANSMDSFTGGADLASFPSGHTTVAFAVSAILADHFDHPLASIALYTTAGLTGYSRMLYNKHWFSDVLAAAVIGYGTGQLVLRLEGDEDSQVPLSGARKLEFGIVPTLDGVSLWMSF